MSGSHRGVPYGSTAKMFFEVDAAYAARLTVTTEEAASIAIGPIAVERLSFLNRTSGNLAMSIFFCVGCFDRGSKCY